jgi:5-amino-6-(5-phosphoribosylamino)uracil reductase
MAQRLSTTVILAMSADGKIADYSRSPARFGSSTDKKHLEKQISLVDAVLFGAGTLRAYGTTLTITNQELLKQRKERVQFPQPINLVCSASAKLSPNLKFFHQPVPRWLLTTVEGAKLWQGKEEFERVLVAETKKQEIVCFDWKSIFIKLQQLGIKKLAVLGGGELVASLLEANLIDDLWLTICPILLGGRNSPTPVEGYGLNQQQAKYLQLLSLEQIGQEIFIHYQIKYDYFNN